RFSVADYEKMVEAGILSEDSPVELIEGLVVQKMPKNPPHESAYQRIRKRIERLITSGWTVRPHMATKLPDSKPEPDVAAARGDDADYDHRHPEAADLGLVVEVSDSTLLTDQNEKARMYARAGIVQYCIVNIPDRQIELYTQPSGPTAAPAYAHVQVYRPG